MNPLFVDGESYNFHLLNESPCIDAGNSDSVYLGVDHDSNTRILDGNDDGDVIVDIGAYEYVGLLNTSIAKKKSQSQAGFVYPNPTNGVLYIAKENFNKVCVYDVTGRIVLSKSSQKQKSISTIDISGFKDGVYFIHLMKANKSYSSIIIKK